jgi:hypothetical protein
MANSRFVGVIADKSTVNSTKTTGKAVLNLTVEKSRELVAGIMETVKARVVLFGADAEKAEAKLDVGKVVLFSDIRRNPRIYTTEAGTQVESVDLVARGFDILKKADYEANKDALEKLCIDLNTLEFTDEDRKMLEKADEALAASVA